MLNGGFGVVGVRMRCEVYIPSKLQFLRGWEEMVTLNGLQKITVIDYLITQDRVT